MTPEEHYARGLELLDLAERSTEVGLVHANGVLAQTHFSAATAGSAMQLFQSAAKHEAAQQKVAKTDG